MRHGASVSAAIAGCLITVQAVTAYAAPAPTPVTRVFVAPDCLITSEKPDEGGSQFLPGLIAIVAPVLLGYVIDAVVADLQKIKKEESAGSLQYNLYSYDKARSRYPTWNGKQGCLTVITAAGSVTDSQLLSQVKASADTATRPSLAQIQQRLSENGITAEDIHSIIELKLDYASDASAYRYVPMYYRFDKHLSGSKGRKRGVAYNLSLLGPGATANGTQYNSAVVQVGEMSGPTVLDRRAAGDVAALDKMTTGWVQRPGLTPASFASYLRRSREAKPAALELMPAVLRAELVQIAKPSDVAKFAAAILSGSKAGLVAAAGKELTPVDADDQRQKVLNADVAIKAAEAELAVGKAENNPTKIALAEAKLTAANDLRASLD